MAETGRIRGTDGESGRNSWVSQKLRQCVGRFDQPRLLDVGAGLGPYRDLAIRLGYEYTSQDFSAYVPAEVDTGLHTDSWNYPKHDYVCDILETPPEAASSVVLCTEVLEHVPDPVRAFKHLVDLTLPSGFLVVTVPFISLTHQAPYLYQSGFSQFWFDYWAAHYGLETIEITLFGDHADFMAQELRRLMVFQPRIRGLPTAAAKVPRSLRSRIHRDLLEAGANGTFFLGRRRAGGEVLA